MFSKHCLVPMSAVNLHSFWSIPSSALGARLLSPGIRVANQAGMVSALIELIF